MSYSRFSWPIAGTAVAVVALGLFMASVTLAAKPTDDTGAFLGNGAPSGPHFNLIFNAKQDHFTCPPAQFEVVSDGNGDGDLGTIVESCDPEDVCEQVFGNVIFMPRDQGNDAITVVMASGAKGPKSKQDAMDLEVTDWCTESFPDDGGQGLADGAMLRLPKNAEGYAVYGWVKGKLGERTFEAVPSLHLAEDEAGNNLLLLGMVSQDGVFNSDGLKLSRTDTKTKGRGNNNFTNLTGLFEWTGSACYLQEDVDPFCLDEFGNYVCTARDLCCVDQELDGLYDRCDDIIDVGVDPDGDANLECPLLDADGFGYVLVTAACRDYSDAWVFNIADFVEVLWDITSNAYNVQIRFYPLPLK
jgi:hypothetical protein